MLLYALDLSGVFLFAIGGALRGVERRLDLFGVLALAFAAAVSGGVARDVMIGATPVAAIVDWRYLAVAVCAGLVAFYAHGLVLRWSGPGVVLDAVGLALFAVNGALKALDYGLSPLMAAVLGMVTGVGGGVARDILTLRVPLVLRSELYAVSAFLGALGVVLAVGVSVPPTLASLFGGAVCVALRLTSFYNGWSLPVARFHRSEDGADPPA